MPGGGGRRAATEFQGYTTDTADALIGLGASSIGRLPQGYVQNMVATGEYQRMAGEGGVAVVKGIELSADDQLRSHVIERLMCDFTLDLSDLRQRFGTVSQSVRLQAHDFAARDRDGIVALDGDVFAVTEAGRPFVRNIAAIFDTYLGNGRGRHSVAV